MKTTSSGGRKLVGKKIKTATGWTYRGIVVAKTPGGNYHTPNKELPNSAGWMLSLLFAIDDLLDSK